MDTSQLRQIIADWARELPYKMNIYLFGSRSKGNSTERSDIDIAIEFLEPSFSAEHALLLWFDNHDNWEKYLTETVGVQVDLEMFRGDASPKLKAALSESSTLLYSS